MKTVNKMQEATFIEFQPGDGTIYKAFLTLLPNKSQVYIALGSGPYIEGGYVANFSSLHDMGRHLALWAKQDLSDFGHLMDKFSHYPFINYWQSHFKSGNKWTSCVALLLAMVFAHGNIDNEEHVKLIGYLHNHDAEKVLEILNTFPGL